MLAFPVRCLQNSFVLLACVREREGVLVAVAMLAEGRKDFWARERERERERELRDAVGCVHRDVSDTRAE
jgi:hypothetical protein